LSSGIDPADFEAPKRACFNHASPITVVVSQIRGFLEEAIFTLQPANKSLEDRNSHVG